MGAGGWQRYAHRPPILWHFVQSFLVCLLEDGGVADRCQRLHETVLPYRTLYIVPEFTVGTFGPAEPDLDHGG